MMSDDVGNFRFPTAQAVPGGSGRWEWSPGPVGPRLMGETNQGIVKYKFFSSHFTLLHDAFPREIVVDISVVWTIITLFRSVSLLIPSNRSCRLDLIDANFISRSNAGISSSSIHFKVSAGKGQPMTDDSHVGYSIGSQGLGILIYCQTLSTSGTVMQLCN